jgi:hypothetical protein
LRTKGDPKELPYEYQNYLSITRRFVGVQWHERKRYIPVDASFAALELSQSSAGCFNRTEFEKYFYDYIQIVHGIYNVSPSWVQGFFEHMRRFVEAQLTSFAAIFEKTLELITPGDTASDAEIEISCNELFDWLLANKDDLVSIGGLAIYAAVYAIAGSPDARRVLKVKDARKSGSNEVAWNVAWDFVYLSYMDNLYLFKPYSQSTLCTADAALANLMASRIHKGPQYSQELLNTQDSFEVDGDLEPFKFKKLEGTKLSKRIFDKYLETLAKIEKSKKRQTMLAIFHHEMRTDFLFRPCAANNTD